MNYSNIIILNNFIKWCQIRHDNDCNQKYDNTLPYSFHLKQVVLQAKKFKHLIKEQKDFHTKIIPGCYGHYLIEDVRVTYNDIFNKTGKDIADIIYCCTEDKGKTREERHSDKYLTELSQNRLAVFVKLCDIIANVKYGLLTNSSQYERAKGEHIKYKKFLHKEGEYDEMWEYLENLLKF